MRILDKQTFFFGVLFFAAFLKELVFGGTWNNIVLVALAFCFMESASDWPICKWVLSKFEKEEKDAA